MNQIVNKVLLSGNKFMLKMHWRQPGFLYSTWGPFTKKKKRIERFKDTGDSRYIYQNELERDCFVESRQGCARMCKKANESIRSNKDLLKAVWNVKGTLMQIRKSANIFRLHGKIICWRFHIKTTFNSWDMPAWDIWKVWLQTFWNNRIC